MTDHSQQGKDLIDELKRGDEKALNKYFDRYHRGLFVMVNKIVRREDIAEEIVNEAFVKLWRYRERVSNTEHVCSFLYIVSRNGAIEHFRTSGRLEKAIRGLSQLAELTYHEPTENEMKMTQLVEQLHLNIDLLPPQGKKILILRYFMNKEVKVIARLLHLEEQTVRNHIGRSLHFLRKSLADQWMLLLFIPLLFGE
jgi:RNA polymerase sigma-70 factor (ECF subfamily)